MATENEDLRQSIENLIALVSELVEVQKQSRTADAQPARPDILELQTQIGRLIGRIEKLEDMAGKVNRLIANLVKHGHGDWPGA